MVYWFESWEDHEISNSNSTNITSSISMSFRDLNKSFFDRKFFL